MFSNLLFQTRPTPRLIAFLPMTRMLVAVNAIASALNNIPAEPLWRSVEREEVSPRSNSY